MEPRTDPIEELRRTGQLEGPRGARESEFGEILDFLNFVFRSDVGRRPSMGGDYPHLYREEHARYLRHMRLNGRVVSCVSIYPCQVQWGDAVLKVGGIGGVATDPEHRRHGLAGLTLEDCLKVMAEEDFDLSILWTGISDYYRRWGWEHAGQSWRFAMDRTTVAYLPAAPAGDILTDSRDPRVIDGVHELHSRTRRGVVWDRELAEQMINIPTRHKVALLAVDDTPTAYIVYSFGTSVTVKEHGGEAGDVLGLTRAVFDQEGAGNLSIHTPAEETGVAADLLARGCPAQPHYAGMLALLDPQRILRTYGLDDVEVVRLDDQWEVRCGRESARYRRNDLVKLLFGPEQPGGIVHPGLPLPFHYGQLDHM